jgi:hypothetical protein
MKKGSNSKIGLSAKHADRHSNHLTAGDELLREFVKKHVRDARETVFRNFKHNISHSLSGSPRECAAPPVCRQLMDSNWLNNMENFIGVCIGSSGIGAPNPYKAS